MNALYLWKDVKGEERVPDTVHLFVNAVGKVKHVPNSSSLMKCKN
jgi:hypothetical protein